jgi:hypothetical protein
MNELITWLQGHLTDSEKLHAEFLAACSADSYSDFEMEIQLREEAGFKSALEFVLRHVEKE